MRNIKVTDDVFNFIDKAGSLRAQMMEERFSIEMYQDCLEMGMSSPIEHLFWVAAKVLCESESYDVNPEPNIIRNQNGDWDTELTHGIYICPQCRIEKYRVDFLISKRGGESGEHRGPVIVELDGHDFHDKDKRQRSYEKARDRFLVSKGYRVLHFTGSDVVADPFKVAYEALEMVGCFHYGSRNGYDKKDPLGLGSE